MSLLSDPEFLIHSMRLKYLRNVDDPYGPRIISLDPSFQSNPYIVASGLADLERWPELAIPSSPAPSDDEAGPSSRRHSGFPGATGLKYTTTIMGPSRAGAMGLRVSGKRASVSRNSFRYSVRSESEAAQAATAADGQRAVATSPASGSASSTKADGKSSVQDKDSVNGTSPSGNAPVQEDHDPSPEFVPKFKGAAEMEARRRLRMLARAPPGGGEPRPPMTATNLNPEHSSSESSSSDEDEDDIAEDDDDEFDLVVDVDDSMEIDGDEFDPEFAASRGLSINSDSDGVSILSGTNSVMSTSNSSMMASSLVPSGSARARNRLSPVREGQHSEERSAADIALDRPEESAPIAGFEMVTAAPRPDKSGPTSPAAGSSANDLATSSLTSLSDDLFARRPIPPSRPAKSALTAMLAATSSSSSSSNPFAELYSAISGRSESESMSAQVYFPFAREPAGRPLELLVRKDATVEEVLGFALWRYWEEGWLPKLDDGLDGEEDPKWDTKCSATGWILRIAEEDGEVDEDFPPPDRTGKISKFNFDAYAVLEATSSQVQQNKTLESKIQRRLSRIVIKKKKSTGLLNATGAAAAGLVPPTDLFLGTSAGLGSLGSSLGMFASSLGPSSSHGPPMFLRIRIADMADAGHFSTTIQASGGMYMAEVLEAVCQKRKLDDPKDYALILELGAMRVYIPLDRTVKSLQGKRDLTLIRKDTLPNYGVEMGQSAGRTTDPNASIFKRNSESLEQGFSSVFDYTNAYRKYTVYRKVPMLVTRSERLLAIDGGYIHIIPLSNKAKHVFDSGKTPSYHLSSIVACQQSRKSSSTFKLVVHSDAERTKRYDFEAENPKMANEIVQTIRGLKAAMERPSATKQSRRSRHVS